MKIQLLADRFDYLKAVEEVRTEWLEELLAFIGIDIEAIHEVDDSTFVDYLFENKVEIIDYPSLGALRVEYEEEVIGEWAGPELALVRDEENGGFYYKIEIECWSIIEEDIQISD